MSTNKLNYSSPTIITDKRGSVGRRRMGVGIEIAGVRGEEKERKRERVWEESEREWERKNYLGL